jgi:choline dehydrogenase-like flavoprotein
MRYDVAVLGGGLVGSMAALMLQRRGLSSVILESRPWGKEQKVVVGEAITEGSSVFLRHEIGLGDWLKQNAFRKFGFDFLVRPRGDTLPKTMDDCHELLLSLTPLEKNPGAFPKLIPTFHVERTTMNRHVAELAQAAGATYLDGASVEQVELGDPHVVHYADYHRRRAQLSEADDAPRIQPSAISRQLSASDGEARALSLHALRPPVDAEARLDRGELRYLAGQGIGGQVLAAAGPFRVRDGWWQLPVTRDYYDVQLSDGAIYRVFHDLARDSWHIDGCYE